MAAAKRLNYLNVIRLLSFAVVFFCHFIMEFSARNMIPAESEKLITSPNIHIGTPAVALFFMISGAGLILSSEKEAQFDIGRYFKKRVLRILIPYYVASLTTYFLHWYRRIPFTAPKWTIIFNLTAMDGYLKVLGFDTMYVIVGEWFMGCLVILYVLFPFLRACVRKAPQATFWIATVLFAVLAVWNPFPISQHQNVIFKCYDFLIGILLVRNAKKLPGWTVIPALLVIGITLFWPVKIPVPSAFKITGTAASVFLLFQKSEDRLAKHVKFNQFCSMCCTYSYEIFLIHHFVIVVLIDRFPQLRGTPAGLALLVVLILACSILLGIAIHMTAELIIRLLEQCMRRKSEPHAGQTQ